MGNEIQPTPEQPKEPTVVPVPAHLHHSAHPLAHLIYRTGWFRLALAGASGLLLMLSFPPFAYGLLAWVALVPLIIAIFSSPSWKSAGAAGLITGVVFYTISLSFFWEAFGVFGFLLMNLLTIYLCILGASLWSLADRIGLGKAFILLPVFWTGIEFFRSESYDLRFPWLSIGYSQSPYNILIQVCDLGGVYGLTFIIVAVNAAIAWFVLERIRRERWVYGYIAAVFLMFIGLLVYGGYRNQYIPRYLNKNNSPYIPVTVVQEMVGSLDKYLLMTAEAINSQREGIVVWPEVAIDRLVSDSRRRGLVEALARDKKAYIIAGTYEPLENQVQFRNMAIIISPQGELLGEYDKQIPVQLVENIIRPGKRSGIFNTPLAKIGVLICYEAGFSNLALRLARKDVDIIVMPTREVGGWGGLSHRHHASIIPFRAVETRRPILRSAALGISMIVHPTGKVESQIDYLASGVLRGEIQKGIGQTIYVQYGYLFPKLCLLAYTLYLLIIIVLWGWRRMDALSS